VVEDEVGLDRHRELVDLLEALSRAAEEGQPAVRISGRELGHELLEAFQILPRRLLLVTGHSRPPQPARLLADELLGHLQGLDPGLTMVEIEIEAGDEESFALEVEEILDFLPRDGHGQTSFPNHAQRARADILAQSLRAIPAVE